MKTVSTLQYKDPYCEMWKAAVYNSPRLTDKVRKEGQGCKGLLFRDDAFSTDLALDVEFRMNDYVYFGGLELKVLNLELAVGDCSRNNQLHEY